MIGVVVTPEFYAQISAIALQRGVTISLLCRSLIAESLGLPDGVKLNRRRKAAP